MKHAKIFTADKGGEGKNSSTIYINILHYLLKSKIAFVKMQGKCKRIIVIFIYVIMPLSDQQIC